MTHRLIVGPTCAQGGAGGGSSRSVEAAAEGAATADVWGSSANTRVGAGTSIADDNAEEERGAGTVAVLAGEVTAPSAVGAAAANDDDTDAERGGAREVEREAAAADDAEAALGHEREVPSREKCSI